MSENMVNFKFLRIIIANSNKLIAINRFQMGSLTLRALKISSMSTNAMVLMPSYPQPSNHVNQTESLQII